MLYWLMLERIWLFTLFMLLKSHSTSAVDNGQREEVAQEQEIETVMIARCLKMDKNTSSVCLLLSEG